MRGALAALVALSMVTLGCLGGVDDDADDTDPSDQGVHWAEAALVSAHEHTDPALHAAMTTPNFRTIGHTSLISEYYGTTPRGNLCGDVANATDGRVLAAVESRGDVAFSLADVSDPANPQWLGELVMRTTYVYDLAVVPDGRHVALVTSQPKTPHEGPVAGLLGADGGPSLAWRSPCASGGSNAWQAVHAASEDLVPRPNSLLLVSIEDPANPVIVDQRPVGGYGHGISSAIIDDRKWVVATALGCVPGVACTTPGSTVHFYEVADGPAGSVLQPLSTYAGPPPTNDVEGYPVNIGHNDAWLAKHPVTDQVLAYVAAWDAGLVILDVTDPTMPEELSRWTDHAPGDPGDDSGNIHSAHPLAQTWDGRHYTVIGPEIIGHPSELPTGVIRVLDTTDPTDPFEVGAWTLPHDVVWEERLQWSTHYLTVSGRTAFVSMYHGGVWAIDLSDLTYEFQQLDATGVYVPVNVSEAPPGDPLRWAPTLEEVHTLPDGSLATFDSNTGLYTFAFDEAMPVDPPEPWAVEPGRGG